MTKSYSIQQDVNYSAVISNCNTQFTDRKVCILGPNGSGKSTFLLCVSGLLALDSGSISINGDVCSPKQRRERCSIASDSIVIPAFLTAQQVIELNQRNFQLPWPDGLISGFQFAPHVPKTVDTLSTGNLKKLQLIIAFMRKNSVLLLDEPNVALDPISVAYLWQLIEECNNQVVVASNEPNVFESKGFTLVTLQAHQSNISANE